MSDLVPVELSRIIVQQKRDQQYVHLKVKGEDRRFPIVIGFNEAAEIYRKLLGEHPPRPMTYDLLGKIILETGWQIDRVVVSSLSDSTFYATIDMTNGEETRQIDSRPSDAIALAVQFKTPIFCARDVLDEVAPAP